MLMLMLMLLLLLLLWLWFMLLSRREEKRREEKRREGKGREGNGREEQEQEQKQEQKQEQDQEQETQAISSRDYTEEERRAHRTIAPKQTGEKHPSAGEEQERNKEANNIKDVQGFKNKDHMC